jgi:hypothetical protein
VPESKARRRGIAGSIARSRNAAIGCETGASRRKFICDGYQSVAAAAQWQKGGPSLAQAGVGTWAGVKLPEGIADRALSVGTVKNRIAALRWWAQKVDRQNVIARSNDHYGIPERRFVSDGSKAKTIGVTDLEKVRDPHVRMSLELQAAFGLRREESIKVVRR